MVLLVGYNGIGMAIHRTVDLGMLQADCRLVNPARVAEFLSANEWIVPQVERAVAEAPKYFPDSHLALKAATDPEEPEIARLLVIIKTALSAERAKKALDEFRDAVWLEIFRAAKGKLGVILEFA